MVFMFALISSLAWSLEFLSADTQLLRELHVANTSPALPTELETIPESHATGVSIAVSANVISGIHGCEISAATSRAEIPQSLPVDD